MGKIIVAACAIATLLGAAAAPAATTAGTATLTNADHGAVALLRRQNDALRERMGQMQLDLLIADVISGRDPRAVPVAQRSQPAVQVVAFRK